MKKPVTEPETLAAPEDAPTQDLSIRGRFQQYVTPFTQLVLPLFSVRYFLQALEDINPLNVFGKTPPEKLPGWTMPLNERLRRNFAALGMGVIALGGLTFYSKRTYDDMKTLYADAIGYELNKKPEDVNWQDIFLRSNNKAVAVTSKAFITRTITRALAASSFLVPWEIFRKWKTSKADLSHRANLPAGVGIMGLYLASEGFLRSPSFFDEQQHLVPMVINHVDSNPHEIVQSHNIESLLLLQRKHLDKHYKWPVLNSSEGQNQTVLAERIANLMNQTSNNTPRTGPADFTIGKFNYLVGFGLLDKFPESLAFVELANRSPDMQEVKSAAAAIKNGENPKDVFQKFGIDVGNQVGTDALSVPAPAPAAKKFASVAQAKEKITPKSLLDFAAQTANQTPSV